jgi:hypothetical protein
MILLTNVRGDVFIDDRKRDDRMMARDGLQLDSSSEYLVATTQTSSADVHALGKIFRLGPYSYLRVGANKSLEGRHKEFWIARNTKQFLAKIWSLAGGRR